MARLDGGVAEAGLPPSEMPALNLTTVVKCHRHTHNEASTTTEKRKFDEPLAHKVDTLASEFAQITALLLNL